MSQSQHTSIGRRSIAVAAAVTGAIALAASPASAMVSYDFVQSGTGNVLATVTFASPPASSTTAWGLGGSSAVLIGLTLDYTSLGGPTFDWGVNITAGGSDGFINNISANTLASDGPTLNGGSTAVRRFFTTLDGQLNDPRFNVQASIGASSTLGADTFGLTSGGTNNGGAIDAQWVNVFYSGDWGFIPSPGAVSLLGFAGLAATRRRR